MTASANQNAFRSRSAEGPLFVGAAAIGPELDEGAVGSGSRVDVEASAGGVDRCDAVVAAADRGEGPFLVVAAAVGPEINLGAVGGAGAAHVDGFAAGNADHAVLVAAAIQEGPTLVVAAAVRPLLDLRTVGGGRSGGVDRFAAVAGDDLEGTVARSRAAARGGVAWLVGVAP